VQFSVYLLGSDLTAPAPHTASRTLVKLVAAAFPVKHIGQNAIQILADLPWREIKVRARQELGAFSRPLHLYIPEVLPSRELPGVWFEEPVSAKLARNQQYAVFFPRLKSASQMVQA